MKKLLSVQNEKKYLCADVVEFKLTFSIDPIEPILKLYFDNFRQKAMSFYIISKDENFKH